MKTYKQFISSEVNEAFIPTFFKKVGSFIRGDKKKISENVEKMISLEKDFIDKSDELNYNLFNSEFRKTQDPAVMTSVKQKSIMSKRAMETLRIAKNSEVNMLANEISRLCKNNPDLINHYQKEKVAADASIAKYAYEKAKRFKDSEYENEFYNQWQDLDTKSKKFQDQPEPTYKDRYEPDFNFDFESESDLIYSLGIYGKSYTEFIDEINNYSKQDLSKVLSGARDTKFVLQSKLEEYTIAINNLKVSSMRKDPAMVQTSKEKFDQTKLAIKKAILIIDSKIGILKNKLKIK